MAGISDIVSVTITANTRTPTRAGFGTILLMGYHTRFTELFRIYTGLDGLASDGFAADDANGSAIYLMAQEVFSQRPRPPTIKVARLSATVVQTKTLTVTSATEGEFIKVKVKRPEGTESSISRTIPGSSTTTAEATAVAALIDALADVAATAVGAVITITCTAGKVFHLRDFVNCQVKDTTAAGTYVADFTALSLVDDDWYFPLLDINSETIVDAVSAYMETKIKHLLFSSQDSLELTGTGTMASDMKALTYVRSVGIFCPRTDQYPAAAWAGTIAPKDPGSITWKFRSLVGVTPTIYTPTQEINLTTAGWNFYTLVAGLGITTPGVAVHGEFPDVQHGIDWLQARIQERVLGVLANADKVPYEDPSVDMICGEVKSVMAEGERRKFLKKGTSECTGPKVADVAVEDRADRILPDINFGADLAGAIHKVRMNGTLSV